MYATTAMFFFVVGGIEALFDPAAARGSPTARSSSAARYNEFFTMHGTTMVFLMGMPLAAAFGNYLVPLMIGARDVAFPRLNMFGFWVFLFGGMFLYSCVRARRRARRRLVRLRAAHEHAAVAGLPARAGAPTSGPSA